MLYTHRGGSRPCVGGGACLRVRDTSCPLAGSRGWVLEGGLPPPAHSAKALRYLKFYRILIFSTSGLDKIQNSALGHCFSLNRDSCMRYTACMRCTCTPHVRDAITADLANITIIYDLCTCVLFRIISLVLSQCCIELGS